MRAASVLAILDRAHVPPPGHPGLARYKEWWHINVIDEAAGLDLIVNLSLSGDVHRAAAGRAYRIVIVHETARGWTHDFTLRDGLGAYPGGESLALDFGGVTLMPEGEGLALTLAPDEGVHISGRLVLQARADPLMIWKNTSIGHGQINWFVVPRLEATGCLQVDGRAYALTAAPAYHDHNWGAWIWGDNFGWDWGFSAALTETEAGWLSLVYDRTTDKNGLTTLEHSLGLWQGARLAVFFSRRELQLAYQGRFAGDVQRIPGPATLIDPARPVCIPARLLIEAADGANWISASFRPEQALQIAIPAEGLRGLAELNETLGIFTVSGQIGDEAFSVSRRSCFEFLR
jgi:hypothetical protein